MRAPTPAFVLSLIALFVALGGTTYAATSLPKKSVGTKQLQNDAVTSQKIKNGAVTAAKINTNGLTVTNAVHATNADNATNATTASNAASATTAANADALQGMPASSFASAALEPAHVVGAAGEPAFQNGWSAATLTPADEGLSFYKDGMGIVHLQGNVANSVPTTGTIFTLPAGYRPAKDLYFAVYGAQGSAAYVQITDGGDVNEFGVAQTYVGLTNVTFRAGL